MKIKSPKLFENCTLFVFQTWLANVDDDVSEVVCFDTMS